MTDREPLWKEMIRKSDEVWFYSSPEQAERLMCAAELRVIADEIKARWDVILPDDSSFHGDTGMEIYHWICAEADRAEAGE